MLGEFIWLMLMVRSEGLRPKPRWDTGSMAATLPWLLDWFEVGAMCMWLSLAVLPMLLTAMGPPCSGLNISPGFPMLLTS